MTLSYSLATSTRYLLSLDLAKLRSDSKFIVFRLWHVIRSFVADPSTIRLRVLDARLTSSYIPIECGSTTTSDFPPCFSSTLKNSCEALGIHENKFLRHEKYLKLFIYLLHFGISSEFMKTNSYAMKNIWKLFIYLLHSGISPFAIAGKSLVNNLNGYY